MNFFDRKAAIGGLIALFLPFAACQAQLGDLLKQTPSDNTFGAPTPLGGVGNVGPGPIPSTTNITNAAGVLEYCIQNNYLGDNNAISIGNSLKDKVSRMPPSSNNNYTDGLKGILHGQDGKLVNLGGSGLKAAATQQICDTVLATAKSML